MAVEVIWTLEHLTLICNHHLANEELIIKSAYMHACMHASVCVHV